MAVVYGLVDVAVEHVTNVGASGDGLNRMASATGSLPSRIGFRASEDLGDGLSAAIVIEQGFAPNAGTFNQGGRAFGRQSYVGFVAPWGSLAVGRQYTMLFWSILDADILGTNIYGSGSLDAYIPNARADNAITYRGTFSGLTVGATFSLGRDSANAGNPAATNCPGEASDARECREWSALLKYDSRAWGAALAVDQIHGGPGAFAGLASSALKDRRLSVNGYVMSRTSASPWASSGETTTRAPSPSALHSMRRWGTSTTPALWPCRSAAALRAAAPCREPGRSAWRRVCAIRSSGATPVEKFGHGRAAFVEAGQSGRDRSQEESDLCSPGNPVGVDGQALARPFASARGGR